MFSRAVYKKSATTSYYYIPTGIIEFHPIPRITSRTCFDKNGAEQCFQENKKFRAPETNYYEPPTNYYFVFTSHVWNKLVWAFTKISVRKKEKNSGQESLEAEFYDYGAVQVDSGSENAGRNFITVTFTVLMQQGDEIWLENDMPNSLMFGPEQYQCEWMIYKLFPNNSPI